MCQPRALSPTAHCLAAPTLLLLQQILLLLVGRGLRGFYLRGQLGVDVVAVADVVHAAAAARDNPLHLLGLLGFRGLIPVWEQAEEPQSDCHVPAQWDCTVQGLEHQPPPGATQGQDRYSQLYQPWGHTQVGLG